ncbi:hypothetical protein [Pacificoceanicola onchidii]|uniref:hypothetical protein n=1 Tax=Pacificoceanicola onchidii TaxID=2562685 RepID=UPI0010A5CEE2|nr:hypothetical protein [Pacificoceanicola onchidii]
MKEFGPGQDREGQIIREILLYGSEGFVPVRKALLRALEAVTDGFESIRQAALASDSAKDPAWRGYMYDENGGRGLANDWFREFSGPTLARLGTGFRGHMRADFEVAVLDFAGIFIPEACKLLAQDLRTKPQFLQAESRKDLARIGGNAFKYQTCPKVQVFAALNVLGYPQVSGAQAADLPHYLGGLDAFARAIALEAADNVAALDMLCKADLAIGLSVVLEERRVQKVPGPLRDTEFAGQAFALVRTARERSVEWSKAPKRGRAAFVMEVDLGGGGAVHNPLRILSALELYYAAVAGSTPPERGEEAFDPDALKAVPWTKLRHLSFVGEADSLDADFGDDGDATLLDFVDAESRADAMGYQKAGYSDQIAAIEDRQLERAGFLAEPKQKTSSVLVARHLNSDLPGEETLGMALLHDSLPKLKDGNPGARNAFLVKWKDMVKGLAARLTALSASNPSIPKKAATNQSGKPSWATPEDTGFGPYLVAAHTFIGARLKSLAAAAQGDAK